MATPKYELPDRGDTLVDWAGEIGGERAAEAIAAEVNRVRRPDGALTISALQSGKKDSPLGVLGLLLQGDLISVQVWSEFGVGRFERKATRKQVEQIFRESGLEAAVDWVLANATKGAPAVSLLRQGLENGHDGVLGETYLRQELQKRLRNWK
jgi:hypothetical protein